ncbi:hypothetical protein [Spirillospora albida]|nr:hypothetical protein [Spirillospora albida]
MICQPCRDRRHDQCRGGSWCDCQHQPAREEKKDDGAPSGEPRVNWRRQG